MKLRAATSDDAAAISEIYAPYVTGSAASFETDPPGAEEMRARLHAGGALYPWIVAEDEAGALAGYAYATAFRPRPAYRYCVVTSVYLAADFHGRGIGERLYRSLLGTLEAQGFAQAIAAITLPNAASVHLHEKLGFTSAGAYRQVGHKFCAWHYVGLWQRPLAPADPPNEPATLDRIGLVLL